MAAHGTVQIAGEGSIEVQFPSGMKLEKIVVTTPPGVPGSNTQQGEVVTWSQQLVRPGWWRRRTWVATISWNVVVPRELTYQTQ